MSAPLPKQRCAQLRGHRDYAAARGAELAGVDAQRVGAYVVELLEPTYHRRRRQATLGRLTPIEYETIMTNTAAQAA